MTTYWKCSHCGALNYNHVHLDKCRVCGKKREEEKIWETGERSG